MGRKVQIRNIFSPLGHAGVSNDFARGYPKGRDWSVVHGVSITLNSLNIHHPLPIYNNDFQLNRYKKREQKIVAYSLPRLTPSLIPMAEARGQRSSGHAKNNYERSPVIPDSFHKQQNHEESDFPHPLILAFFQFL